MVNNNNLYLYAHFLMFRKAVKPSRGKVKQIYGNKCVPTVRLNSVNTAADLHGKTHNIIESYAKHMQPSQNALPAKVPNQLYAESFFAQFVCTG